MQAIIWIIGLAVSIYVASLVFKRLKTTKSSNHLSDRERNFLSLMRMAIIASAAFSLFLTALFGVMAIVAVLISAFLQSGFGIFQASQYFTYALQCFAGFIGAMLVFLLVAIEMHIRKD